MDNILEASVKLLNGRMKYECRAGDNPPVITDYTPPMGDGEGYTSLQLFLISFATCSGGVVAPFLKRMGKNVAGLTIRAEGKRRTEHPTCFESIRLYFEIKSDDVTDGDVQKVLAMAEEKYCPVWAMIKNNVTVETQYVILPV
jgi:putative redox protein